MTVQQARSQNRMGTKKKPLKCVIIMYTDHDYSIVLGIHTKPPVWECVREV